MVVDVQRCASSGGRSASLFRRAGRGRRGPQLCLLACLLSSLCSAWQKSLCPGLSGASSAPGPVEAVASSCRRTRTGRHPSQRDCRLILRGTVFAQIARQPTGLWDDRPPPLDEEDFAVSSADQFDGEQAHAYCTRCGFPFADPTRQQDVCNYPTACEKRLRDPTYRVPPDRLADVEVRMRQHLIERARNTSPDRAIEARITYGGLCKTIDPKQRYWSGPRFRGLGKVLARIGVFEHAHGRPLLTALVVRAGTFSRVRGLPNSATASATRSSQVRPRPSGVNRSKRSYGTGQVRTRMNRLQSLNSRPSGSVWCL